jgi:nucleotide-binding universal stress UspA family protein
MIKDILVGLSVGKPRDIAGEFAVSVAARFGAHLSGVAFAQEPPIGAPWQCITGEIFNEFRAKQKAEAQRVIMAFEACARLEGVTHESRIVAETIEDAAKLFGATARHYDLSVVAQAEPEADGVDNLTVQAALFASGRPVLVVPYIQNEGLKLNRVMVCWDGSRSAARAVADALPLLQHARQIDVMTVEAKERRNALPGAQIAGHLARHKITVDLKTLVSPDVDVTNVILSQAADNGTDLIVMGGYGHSRLRQFVLGGATRDMLASMTVPVFMAH